MTIKLTAEQCRVIGVMLEKETTTPEQYPLSLNGLTNACNQKSNREPVMSLTESQVQNIVDELMQLNQISDQGAFGGRVAKYRHRFCNTEFGDLQFTPQQRAIICLLLLRGPQTPGELRTRTTRLADFTHVGEVEAALESLQDFQGGALVVKLPREPGKRESRYAQLFCDVSEPHLNTDNCTMGEIDEDVSVRLMALEEKVANLTKQMADLLAQLQ